MTWCKATIDKHGIVFLEVISLGFMIDHNLLYLWTFIIGSNVLRAPPKPTQHRRKRELADHLFLVILKGLHFRKLIITSYS